jgi:glycogen synthase
MKILLVSEDMPSKKLGGLGKHVVALGNALIAAGHEVALMGRDTPSYTECADEIEFQGRFIAGFGNPLKGWKESQLGFFNPWKRPYFARRMAKAIQSYANEFDVVHYHGHQPMVGRYIPSSLNFIQTRHDQGGDCITNVRFRHGDVCRDRSPAACAKCIHPKPGAIRTALSTMAVQRYRTETERAYALHPVVFVSEFLRENFQRTMPGARLATSTVIHNFFDEQAISEIRTRGTYTPSLHLTKVHVAGRLDAAKGIAELLDLLVPRLPPNWVVSVCGDGPLRRQIEQKHSGPGVRFHGHASHETTLLSASTANVCVVPSLCEEAFGLVTLEALRLGKSCFALSRGGTPELMRYGANGQLRLFDTLPQLVDALLAENTFKSYVGGDTADVAIHISDLMAIYQRRLTVPR